MLCFGAGLCGNFNLVLSDELTSPQGVVEGTATSFGNSWKAQSNCPDRTESLDDPCSYNIDSGEKTFTQTSTFFSHAFLSEIKLQ